VHAAEDGAVCGEGCVIVAVIADEFGDAEVGDFHLAGVVDEDVFRFDVAVEDALGVSEFEGGADFSGDG
jgi:hypothetical protein